MEFKFYQDDKGEWRWRLVAKNGKIVAVSGEGYKRKRSAEKTVRRIFDAVLQSMVEAHGSSSSKSTPPSAKKIICPSRLIVPDVKLR